MTRRAAAILAVANVDRPLAFYRDRLGFEGGCRFVSVDPDGYLVEIEQRE